MDRNRKLSSRSTTTTTTVQYVSYSRHLSTRSTNRSNNEQNQQRINIQSQSTNDNSIIQRQNNPNTLQTMTNLKTSKTQQNKSSNSLGINLMISNTQIPSENRRSNKRKKSSNRCPRSCLCIVLLSLCLIGVILSILLPSILIKHISTTTEIAVTNTFTTLTTTSSSTSSTTSTTTTSSSSTTSTTVLITGNVTTGITLSNWYGTSSLYFRCSGVIRDAIVEIDILKTNGLTYSGQYQVNGGVFINSTITNSTHIIYRWKMNSGTTIVCGNLAIQFFAQFSLNGIAHSTTNDYYLVTTTNNLNITNTINGYF